MMTNDILKKCWPNSTEANRQKFLPHLNRYLPEYGIISKTAVAAFVAQIGHESGQGRHVEELASGEAYEYRKDLGNVTAGDGRRFKGRGLIQITGRTNYTQITKAFSVDFVKEPHLLSQPEWAVRSACWWWANRKLTAIADGAPLGDEAAFRRITKTINGGYNGWADRWKLYGYAIRSLENLPGKIFAV
jgi:putative chitinase